MSALSREEMEVIICWDMQNKLATIEVPVGTSFHKRLESIKAKYVQSRYMQGEEVSRVYEVPASWIKVNPKRQYTPEQQERMSLNARARFHPIQENMQ